jgi:hypothetical protein
VRTEIEGLVDSEAEEEFFSREQAKAIKFFRSIGFRRIGSTYWFGLAFGGVHPSHLIVLDDDYDPLVPRTTAPSSIIQLLQLSLMQPAEQESPTALEQHLQHTPSTDLSWLATDKEGNTLLPIAGLNLKPASVKWIMKQDFGLQMLEMLNNEGDMPLEAALIKLEAIRTRNVFRELEDLTTPQSDKFKGHSKESVACLAKLKGLTVISSLEFARLSCGCACGQ